MQQLSTENEGARRSQVSRACSRCKRLRRKCSDFRPCRRCIDQGLGEECLASPGPVQIHDVAHELVEQPADELSEAIVDFCADRFFERLFPTIPIITLDYMVHLKEAAHTSHPAPSTEARSLLSALCALVFLQAEDPDFHIAIGPISQPTTALGEDMLNRAAEAHRGMLPTASPSLEMVLLTFFLYACHAALLHHGLAFFYLREATTLWHLRDAHPHKNSHPFSSLGKRLFWVLLVSERSHAIRYRRSITMLADPGTEPPESTASLTGYSSLAALFRPLNTLFFGLLNGEGPSLHTHPQFLDDIESSLNTALHTAGPLHDTQKANLGVTQRWLRIVLWRLRLHLGYLRQESASEGLTYAYPLQIARELVPLIRELELKSMSVHGVGLTEKLFDIAAAVIDVLARVPVGGRGPDTADSEAGQAQRDLDNVRQLIRQLPGGQSVYDELLERQIETCGTDGVWPSTGVPSLSQ